MKDFYPKGTKFYHSVGTNLYYAYTPDDELYIPYGQDVEFGNDPEPYTQLWKEFHKNPLVETDSPKALCSDFLKHNVYAKKVQIHSLLKAGGSDMAGVYVVVPTMDFLYSLTEDGYIVVPGFPKAFGIHVDSEDAKLMFEISSGEISVVAKDKVSAAYVEDPDLL